jgi:CBS domain-containing protein
VETPGPSASGTVEAQVESAPRGAVELAFTSELSSAPGEGAGDREGNTLHVHNILKLKGSAVATIEPTATLADATASLRDHGVGALVVSRDDRTIDGILSERDVVRALAAHGGSTLGREVLTAMSTSVTTCHGHDTADQLMAMMTERRIRHLPVVDDDGHLAGIISIGDVVKARVGQLEHENNQLHDYIQAR